MKTTNNTNKNNRLAACMVIAMAFAAWLSPTAGAAEKKTWMPEMKGYEHSMMLNHINTRAQVEALKPGDSIAMACAKCKSVVVEQVSDVSTTKGNTKTVTVFKKHLCPGCGGTVETVGHGQQDKHAVLTHTCSKCGDGSAFCCATKPGSGSTKGMEKQKNR